MEIRLCQAADYRRIQELNRYAFGYEYPVEKTRQRLAQILARPSDKIFVVCDDEQLIGYIHAADYECTYSDSLKNIMAIAVDEAYRGRGAGRMLLTAVEDWARECGCEGVRLVSGFNRTGAHSFYLSCGYHLRKEQKNFIKLF